LAQFARRLARQPCRFGIGAGLVETLDIAARDEGFLTGAAHDYDLDGGIGGEGLDHAQRVLGHARRKGVQLAGIVPYQPANGAARFRADQSGCQVHRCGVPSGKTAGKIFVWIRRAGRNSKTAAGTMEPAPIDRRYSG
jgi:hypothetical protein